MKSIINLFRLYGWYLSFICLICQCISIIYPSSNNVRVIKFSQNIQFFFWIFVKRWNLLIHLSSIEWQIFRGDPLLFDLILWFLFSWGAEKVFIFLIFTTLLVNFFKVFINFHIIIIHSLQAFLFLFYLLAPSFLFVKEFLLYLLRFIA